MRVKILSLLGVEKGEVQLVGLTLLQSFFFGIARLFTLTAAKALLLARFGAGMLPYVYVGVAVALPLIGMLFLRIQRRVPFKKLLLGTLLFLILSLGIFRFLLNFKELHWLSLVLVVWYEILFILSGIVFFNVANRMFTLRQAKRLYGLVGVGEVVAIILCGFFTPVIVGALGTPNLLLLSIGALVASCFNLNHMLAVLKLKRQEPSPGADTKSGSMGAFLRKKYTRLVFGIITFSSATYFLLDFVFYGQLEVRFGSSSEIAAFLGIFQAVYGFLNLLIKLLVTNRWMKAFGLTGALQSPSIVVGLFIILFIAANLFGASPAFLFFMVLILKLLDIVFRSSINNPAYYALFQSMPEGVKDSAQNFGDTIVAQIAIGIVCVGLIIIKNFLPLSALQVCLGVLILHILWLLDAGAVGKGYIQSLGNALTRHSLKGIDFALHDSSTIKVLEEGAHQREFRESIYCIHLLRKMKYPGFVNLLADLCNHKDARVRREVFLMYEELRPHDSFELLMECFAREEDPLAMGALLRALASMRGEEVIKIIKPFLFTTGARLDAVAALVRHCGIEGTVLAGTLLTKLQKSEMSDERIFMARALGAIGHSGYYRPLLELLHDHSPRVRRQAIKAAGLLKNPGLWPGVIENLSIIKLRASAAKVLIQGGATVFPALDSAYSRPGGTWRFRRRCVKIIGRIGGVEAVKSLLKKLGEPVKAVLGDILGALKRCHFRCTQKERGLMKQLLKDEVCHGLFILVLQRDLDQLLEEPLLYRTLSFEWTKARQRILDLIFFLFPHTGLKHIWKRLRYGSEDKKAYALELLDHCLDKETKKFILPLFENDLHREIIEHTGRSLLPESLPPAVKLERLCFAEDFYSRPWLRSLAIYSARDKNLFDLKGLCGELTKEKDPLLKDSALFVLASKEERLKNMPIVEKVRNLKGVNIFKEVPLKILARLAVHSREERFPRGEMILEKGEIDSFLYIICRGEVGVFDGQKSLVNLSEGSVFGELATHDFRPRRVSIRAVKDTEVLCVESERLYDFIYNRIEAARAVINVLCKRIRGRMVQDGKLSRYRKLSTREADSAGGRNFPMAHDMSLMEKMLILKRIDLFAELSDSVLTELVHHTSVIYLNKSDLLYKKGGLGRQMYILISGEAAVISDEETITAQLEAGDTIGELDVLTAKAYAASVTATKPAVFLSLNQQALYDLMWSRGEVVQNLILVLIRRLRKVSS